MGKSKKNKNEPNQKIDIQEPQFEEKKENTARSAGDKKLLAQKERERKEQEDLDKLKKERTEAGKKKNNKASNKTKIKQDPPRTENKSNFETPKPKNIRNENEGYVGRFQETRKPENKRNEDFKDSSFQDRRKSNTSWNEDEAETEESDNWRNPYKEKASRFQETRNPKNTQNENVTRVAESTSTQFEGNDHWNYDNSKYSKVGKSDYSMKKQFPNDGNKSFGRSNYNYTFSDGKNDKDYQKFLNNRQNFYGKVREETGDLFDAPGDYSLAHCVAEDFSMGAGIAKEFKIRFKRVSQLLDQNVKTGGLAILEDKDRFIYYLVTKKYSKGKPTSYTLWNSLLKLRDHITEHKVSKLAIPQIGCGLDRLDWTQVKQMLEYVFNKNEIDIVVYILDFNADETPNPSKALRLGYVVQTVQPLTDIESGTGLIFLGTEDGAVTPEIECLAKKFDFVDKYKTQKKSTGDVVKIIDRNEYLYGLIIRRTINNRISFADFERCLFNLRKMLKTDNTTYIGLQGFVERDDEVITEKLANLMKLILQDVEMWVCWPEKLAHLCPQQKN